MPRNSTILNNLGQVWFGLGDLDKAGKYPDSTINLYACHPLVQMTKAAIEEKIGNTSAAIDHVKIHTAFFHSWEAEQAAETGCEADCIGH